MKLKILIIGILVLLLCTTVPMAATAKPTPMTTVKDTVYMLELSTIDYQYYVTEPTGKVTVNTDTSTCRLSCSNLVPNGWYGIGITKIVGPDGLSSGAWVSIGPIAGASVVNVQADAHGRLSLKEVTIPQYGLDYYSQGGVFVVLQSLPP